MLTFLLWLVLTIVSILILWGLFELVRALWPIIILCGIFWLIFGTFVTSAFDSLISFMSQYQLSPFGWDIVYFLFGALLYSGLALWFGMIAWYVFIKPLVTFVNSISP